MIQGHSKVTLGIDIGTTKVAVSLVDAETRDVLATGALAHESDVQGLPVGRSEQVVSRILATLDSCLEGVAPELRRRVRGIGVTGQMHGVVLWNPASGDTSHLFTWQDQRCHEEDFLRRLREKSGDGAVQSGFGAATIAWLAAHQPEALRRYSCAGTIHDYLVTLITASPKVATDPSDAASWGFFDLRKGAWSLEAVERAGVPSSLLPEVRSAGARVGNLQAGLASRWGIPAGVPVGTAFGDNQASLYGSLTDPSRQMALTIGTGAQLSVVVPQLPKELPSPRQRYEFRPYVGGSFIAVAASLTGGRALAALGRALESFMREMAGGSAPSLDAIQSAMHEQGLVAVDTDLRANASLSGERSDPNLRGSFTNLSFDNFTIGDMTAALCRGLVEGLRDALPSEFLQGHREVVGSGNAIRRSPLMQQVIREAFGCSLVLTEGSETTASGAALLASATL